MFYPHFMAYRAISANALTPRNYEVQAQHEPSLWTNYDTRQEDKLCYVLPFTPSGHNFNAWFGPAGSSQPKYCDSKSYVVHAGVADEDTGHEEEKKSED